MDEPADTSHRIPFPSTGQIAMAMMLALQTGRMTQKDVDLMDELPMEKWPAELWDKLGLDQKM